jgi:hypothetical protein
MQDQRYSYDIGAVCDTRVALYSQCAVDSITNGSGEKDEMSRLSVFRRRV